MGYLYTPKCASWENQGERRIKEKIVAVSSVTWGRSTGGKRGKLGATVGGRRGQERAESPLIKVGRLLRQHGRNVLGVVALVILVLGGVSGLRWVIHRPYFQIRHAVITGDLHQVDRALVAKAAERVQGSFFSVDLAAAASELKAIPWIRAVHLRRVWPDALEVQVEEQNPVAYWGDDALLNEHGEPFEADYLGELPHFVGPREAGQDMIQAWQHFNQWVKPLGRRVDGVELSARGAWTLSLDDGTQWRVGRDQVDNRVQRFVQVYPELHKAGVIPPGGKVDLRYANGFAISGAGGSAEE